MKEFLSMGGYGAFVWSAYGLAFLVLTVHALLAYRALRETQKRLRGRWR